jgi:Ser/Thr protein kinase RdoA (MazF antagonist)
MWTSTFDDQPPPPEVLERLKIVGIERYLGGRANFHWLARGKDNIPCVLRRWSSDLENARYEHRVMEDLWIRTDRWPTPYCGEDPVEIEGTVWSRCRYLRGEPAPDRNSEREQLQRGRLMAQFHQVLKQMRPPQRPGWRRCEQILTDPEIDPLLAAHEGTRPEAVHVLRIHLEEARRRVEGLDLPRRRIQLIHGDFAPWNLLFVDGDLSGVLDFEMAHLDHRVMEFAHSWRGRYDDVIRGYDEVSPLSPEEWRMIVPVWWALLVEIGCRLLREGQPVDSWIIAKLKERSPMMVEGRLG